MELARDCCRLRRGKGVPPSRWLGSHEMERSLKETVFRSGFGVPVRLFCCSAAASESPRGRVKAHQRLGSLLFEDWNEATDGRDVVAWLVSA
jgi:hypothetical protein